MFLIVPKEHSPFTRPLISVAHSFFPQLSILFIFSVTHLFTYTAYFLTMMMIDHDAFLPAVVMTSYTPCCTNISRQYDGTQHYNDNTAQHGKGYNSTPRTSLPLPVDSTCTSEFNVTVHNDKLLDSTHYTTRDISTSQSLAHSCSDRTTDSTCIVICSGRQHCVAVPLIDVSSSSQCRTRHIPTGGVPRNGYVLVLNPNLMPTCASTGSVNPNPITGDWTRAHKTKGKYLVV